MGVPPLDSQAPPLTRGNASYCGFQAYLGCTPVWLVISVGCLCPVMLENGNLAEARAEVLPAVSGWLYGLREGAGWLWAP